MTFKKILAGVMACAITVGAGTVHKVISPVQTILTASAEPLGDLFYEIHDDGVIITGCNSLAKSVDIPAEIGGLPVISIEERAFNECYNLESVTIPDSVESIGECAFSHCTNLESISISNSVTIINVEAFFECTSLKSVIIPDSVKSIYDEAFYGCTGLESIIIPDSVSYIGMFAFRKCTSLESIIIPASASHVDFSAFSDCTSLETIDVSDKNENFSSEDGILFNKDKTELLLCPDGKKAEYTIPDTTVSIRKYAFSGCTSLEKVTIPDFITSIEEGTFNECSIENIVILNPECEIFDDRTTICNSYDYDRGGFYFIGTIFGYENSTAQKYAEKYGYKFESLGEYKPAASGDLNGDGKTDAEDVEKIQRALTGKEPITEDMDLNSDSKIDVFDAMILRRKILTDM